MPSSNALAVVSVIQVINFAYHGGDNGNNVYSCTYSWFDCYLCLHRLPQTEAEQFREEQTALSIVDCKLTVNTHASNCVMLR